MFTKWPSDDYSYVMNNNCNVNNTAPLTANVWHHIAYVRKNGNINAYLDGAVWIASRQVLGSISSGTDGIWLGWAAGLVWLPNGGPYLKGYIDDFRIIDGQAVPMAVPTSALTV